MGLTGISVPIGRCKYGPDLESSSRVRKPKTMLKISRKDSRQDEMDILISAAKRIFPELNATNEDQLSRVRWHVHFKDNGACGDGDDLQLLSEFTDGFLMMPENAELHLRLVSGGETSTDLEARTPEIAAETSSSKAFQPTRDKGKGKGPQPTGTLGDLEPVFEPKIGPKRAVAETARSAAGPGNSKSVLKSKDGKSKTRVSFAKGTTPDTSKGDEDGIESGNDLEQDEDGASGLDLEDSDIDRLSGFDREHAEIDNLADEDSDDIEDHEDEVTSRSSYSNPHNDVKNEINDIPSDSDPDSVYIRLTYEWSKDVPFNKKTMGKGVEDWEPHLLEFSRDEPFRQVIERIEEYVKLRLEELESKTCAYLGKSTSCYIVVPSLQSKDSVLRHAFKIDARDESCVSNLDEVYREPQNLRPELEVLLRHVEHWDRDPGQPRVMLRFNKDVMSAYQFYLIGSWVKKREELDDSEDTKLPAEMRHVPSVDAYLWKCSAGPKKRPKLCVANMWQLNEHCICDLDSAVSQKTLPDDLSMFTFERKYSTAAMKVAMKQLSSRSSGLHGFREDFKSRRENNLEQRFLGWPLTYRFAKFVPSDLKLGVSKFPKPMITVALRFFSHLESTNASKVVFSDREELSIDDTDNYTSIREAILLNMKDAEHKGINKLLKQPNTMGESWRLELWVLPQGLSKLCKYEDGDGICGFLDKRFVAKRDMRLYMEVHIVPM